ncbi:hypothetical protein KIPB_012166 [Kipferlia bialata]|uniref:FHA domain-containing protein n=1 Tax=Kipferlia bialata TaxID=797122 RepID=A0A9K3D935_9EUKA|nr:hypothetical protein KIPB_012166 [Kipferlia bialata]|eukprot:g12166.t1
MDKSLSECFAVLSGPGLRVLVQDLPFHVGSGDSALSGIHLSIADERVAAHHLSLVMVAETRQFAVVVLAPDGAIIDGIHHPGTSPRIPIVHGSTIEICGTRLVFGLPSTRRKQRVDCIASG